MKSTLYIVRGRHWEVPGEPTTVTFDQDAANVRAADLVAVMWSDVAEDAQEYGIEWDASRTVLPGDWQERLLDIQAVRYVGMTDYLGTEFDDARQHVDGLGSDGAADEAECDVWIEAVEVEMPATMQVWHAFSETDNGAGEMFACLSEREGQDWLLGQFGQDREGFDHFMATGAHLDDDRLGVTKPEDRDLNEFIRHICDGCDGWGLTSTAIPVPGAEQPKLSDDEWELIAAALHREGMNGPMGDMIGHKERCDQLRLKIDAERLGDRS